jgi:hypothetical protein
MKRGSSEDSSWVLAAPPLVPPGVQGLCSLRLQHEDMFNEGLVERRTNDILSSDALPSPIALVAGDNHTAPTILYPITEGLY